MTDPTTKVRKRLSRSTVTTAADIAGVVLVCVGVALVYVPAAFILAGAGLLLASWRASR